MYTTPHLQRIMYVCVALQKDTLTSQFIEYFKKAVEQNCIIVLRYDLSVTPLRVSAGVKSQV